MCESELNLAESADQEHLHLLSELGLHHGLVHVSDDVVQGQRLSDFNRDDLVEGLSVPIRRQARVDLLNVLWRWSTGDLVDLLDGYGLVGERAAFQDVEHLAHVAT